MFKRLKLSTYIFPILLVLITGYICLANYTPGTFLTGWDTLHPEFNFPLAFSRMLNGVWRADQGLGAVAIHSHMSELPRIVVLWLLSLVAPLNTLRYITMLAPLIIGPLGVYALTSHILEKMRFKRGYAFLAALCYLCNMGTVGQFIVPFEMFAIQFAFLPWVLLFTLRFLRTGKKKEFLLFALFSLFIVPQAYAATLFYTFFITFLLSLGMYLLLFRSKQALKRIIFLTLATLILNSYWLLPNLYAAKTESKEVTNSQINRFFSPEAFAANQLYGNPLDAALLKSFLFDWKLYNFSSKNSEIVVAAWAAHIKQPVVAAFGYLIFGISVLGIIVSIKRKSKTALTLLPFAIVGFCALLNGTPPISNFFELIGSISPTLKEALRFPFTKFSILWMLGLSLYFGMGISFLLSLLRKKILILFGVIILSCVFLFYFAPAFRGELINPAVRVSIPKQYFELFGWSKMQPSTDRMATLPVHTFWNWVYYSWGYQGSGFLQFGIKQALLDSDYSRWSQYNEQYQREIQYAVYNQNPQYLEKVLQKYNIRFMLLDTSVLNIAGFKNETLSWYIPTLLKQSKKIHLVKRFGSNLFVYEYTGATTSQFTVNKNLPDIGPAKVGTMDDIAYAQAGTYITDKSKEIDTDKKYTTFDEHYIGPLNGDIDYTINSYSELAPLQDCSQNMASYSRTTTSNEIHYITKNASECDYYGFPSLSHKKSYILQVTARNLQGFPLQVYVCNNLTLHCNQTFHLSAYDQYLKEAFIIPSYDDHGEGYTVNINNYAIRNITSVNEVKEITIREYNPAPLSFKQNGGTLIQSGKLISATPGKNVFTLSKNIQAGDTIEYAERFQSGWHAYSFSHQPSAIDHMLPFLFGKEIKSHVLVNNWANGWTIQGKGESVKGKEIIVIFLPQYLEYAGFILLGVGILVLSGLGLRSYRKRSQRYISPPSDSEN